MADNTFQRGNSLVATEDIGGTHIQRMKLVRGVEGVDEGDISDASPMPITDHRLRVAQGFVPGAEFVTVVGINPDVDTAAVESVWLNGGLYTFPSAAEQISVVSSSANDTALGSGARTAMVQGLDAAGLEQTEVITLNGLTPVLTTNTFLHVQLFFVMTGGATGANEGVLTITNDTSGLTLGTVPIGDNATKLGIYMVPSNKTAYLMSLTLSTQKQQATSAEFSGKLRRTGQVFVPVAVLGVSGASGPFQRTLEAPIMFPSSAQLKFDVSVTANNTSVAVMLEMLLVTN